MSRRYGRTTSAPRSRWLVSKFAGTCKVCKATIPAGSEVYWDAYAQTITCHAEACCQVDGLMGSEWHGSPVSGGYVPVRRAFRLGAGDMIRDPGEDAADRWNEGQR